MGSLRNPVGPLPSSIYWRRRAIALCLIALMALLALWAVTSGDGGGKKTNDASNGSSPVPSITPGPSGSGPAISEQPGGRDESGDSGENTGGDSGTEPGGADAGTGAGANTGANTGAESGGKNGDTDGAGGDGGAGASSGQQVPANSPLPNCAPGALQLTLRSTKVSYEPGEKPRFQLVAKNTSATDCKADFSPKIAVLTISDSKDDEVWSSRDCPRPAAGVLLRVPAGSTITYTVEWDRKQSAPQCATAPAAPVGPGTYLVEAAMPGVKVLPASFTLAKD
ncbi:hypothetical protein J7E93_28025 [Streptomyces sp. ISL-36]|uniref:hypothetical protein n=1 Tax=Streptomyces sp. ISL-36 TaxID=2819182 RepID=UPI001BE77A11|nr:hypothetical protein [Streptomyces sp. ISL-36]MBT2443878.1 hypothetical protein [Streptomyces sp. ISL-36]